MFGEETLSCKKISDNTFRLMIQPEQLLVMKPEPIPMFTMEVQSNSTKTVKVEDRVVVQSKSISKQDLFVIQTKSTQK